MSGSSGKKTPTTSTIHQIVDDKGNPSLAAHTEPLWVDRTASNVFSFPTAGNKVQPFTTGAQYFEDLISVCKAAEFEICIAGWQVNWDAQLHKDGTRLYDLLYSCALRGVNIYVMPWNDTEPIQTYDDQTKTVLESINSRLKKGTPKRVHVELSSSMAKVDATYFSHHQKQVVVDRTFAYVGGIDLAYGRMDDENYDLTANADGRHILNRYNPCVPPVGKINDTDTRVVDPDLMTGWADRSPGLTLGGDVNPSNRTIQQQRLVAGGWQVRYGSPGKGDVVANNKSFSSNKPAYVELNPDLQPRMPWQDVHCKIEGPAASDLLRNFVLRWNCVSKVKLKLPKPPSEYKRAGNASIQVLRSAPSKQVGMESEQNDLNIAAGTQQDIHVAMQNIIAKARRFIYIENQFFVSDFGEIGGEIEQLSPAAQFIKTGISPIGDGTLKVVRALAEGPVDQLPRNLILKSLLARFKEVILDDIKKPKFHLYMTLPVHPEGSVLDPSIAVQVYYTMQTLVFGSHSLINGLKRLIKARELKDKKDSNFLRVINDPKNKEHESVDVEQCYEYVTLLNLRNWAHLKGNYVTEQIYIHSKLMIVDDRFAILGSANVNDRSMLGERDSELAVLIMDEDVGRADINGKGSNQPIRVFAHDLRTKIWKKLFGIGLGARAADLQLAVEAPGSPDSWKLIQRLARDNAELFEAAFSYIPRNYSAAQLGKGYASIIPTWSGDAAPPSKAAWVKGNMVAPLPSQEEFWKEPQYNPEVKNLVKVKGFITALPVEWTRGENILIRYPTAIIVNNENKRKIIDEESNEPLVAKNKDVAKNTEVNV